VHHQQVILFGTMGRGFTDSNPMKKLHAQSVDKWGKVILSASYLFVYKILTDLWFKEKTVLFIFSTAVLLFFVIHLELLLVTFF